MWKVLILEFSSTLGSSTVGVLLSGVGGLLAFVSRTVSMFTLANDLEAIRGWKDGLVRANRREAVRRDAMAELVFDGTES